MARQKRHENINGSDWCEIGGCLSAVADAGAHRSAKCEAALGPSPEMAAGFFVRVAMFAWNKLQRVEKPGNAGFST